MFLEDLVAIRVAATALLVELMAAAEMSEGILSNKQTGRVGTLGLLHLLFVC